MAHIDDQFRVMVAITNVDKTEDVLHADIVLDSGVYSARDTFKFDEARKIMEDIIDHARHSRLLDRE